MPDVPIQVSDSLSLADDGSQVGLSFLFSDRLYPSDGLGYLVLSLTGTPPTNSFGRIQDSVCLIDSVAVLLNTIAVIGYAYSPTDTEALSDTTKVLLGLYVSPSDTLSLSDSVGFLFHATLITISISDSISLQDEINFTLVIKFQTIPDTLNFSDRLAANAPYFISFADAIALADSAGTGLLSQPSDTLALSDFITATFASVFSPQSQATADYLEFRDSIQVTFPNARILIGDMLFLFDEADPQLTSDDNNYLRRYLNDI